MDEWRNNNQNNSALIERAKEELENLEMQYPNKFNNLKMELKAFIADIHHYHSHPSYLMQLNNSSISMSAATQESSSKKKRRERGGTDANGEDWRGKVSNYGGSSSKRMRRCKTDAVLERAQQCLHKIQHFKTTLHYC